MAVPLEPHSRGTYLYCIVIHFHIELIFSSATISLTKRQLLVSAKSSLIARRALCRWKRMNGTITVETVVLGHKIFFSTSMFGIVFGRNGK